MSGVSSRRKLAKFSAEYQAAIAVWRQSPSSEAVERAARAETKLRAVQDVTKGASNAQTLRGWHQPLQNANTMSMGGGNRQN